MNLCYGLEISLSNLLKAHLWKGRVTGREGATKMEEREKEGHGATRPPICRFAPQTPSTAWAGPAWSQKPRILSGSPMVARAQHFSHYLLSSLVHEQDGVGSRGART